MAPDEIIIREYKEGDEVQINLLHNKEYGTNRGSEEWRWEFKSGPYGKSILVVAEYKGEIIGTQALLPITLSYGDVQILSAKSEETLLKAEFRGQGVFKRLYDKCFELAAERGIALIWGFTNADKAFIKCGFEVLGRLNRLTLIFDPAQTYKVYRDRIPSQVKSRFRSQVGQKLLLRVFTLIGFLWYKTRNCKIRHSPRFKVTTINQADERFDVFWETFRRKASFYTIIRGSDYLDWRIFRNPKMIYKLLTVIKNDRIQGYVLLGKSKRENMGYMTDLCVLSEYFEEVAELLIGHAVEYFRSQGVANVDAWRVGNNREMKTHSCSLRRFGFVSVPMGSCIVMKVLAEDGNLPVDPNQLNQWFITNLFSEGVE